PGTGRRLICNHPVSVILDRGPRDAAPVFLLGTGRFFPMTTPSAGLVLDYLPLPGGTARLVLVYGDAPCLALPAALPGPEGSALPITELGSYAFSEALRTPPGEGLLRCGVDETGSVHPLPLDPGAELHPIAGRFLEEIALPDSLRVIG